MCSIEIVNLIFGIVGTLTGVPAFIVAIVTLIKNKYRLHSEFLISNYESIFNYQGNTIDKIRAVGNFHYVNYSNATFNIVKIVAIHDSQEFHLTMLNPDQSKIPQTFNRYTPFNDFPIFSRTSGNEPFFVEIPQSLKNKELKLKVYTSYRIRPYKGDMKPALIDNTR